MENILNQNVINEKETISQQSNVNNQETVTKHESKINQSNDGNKEIKTLNKKTKKQNKKQLVKELVAKTNNKVFIANWKMNFKFADIKSFFIKFNKLIGKDKVLKRMENVVIGVAPTAIGLLPVCGMAKYGIVTVSQDVHYEEKGPYTGCVSYSQVHEYGINYVIVSHSEKRIIFNWKYSDVNEEIKVLLENKMIPILCIGETSEEKAANETKKSLTKQLLNFLKDVTSDSARNVIIAYEPIWAVGKEAATIEEIKNNLTLIRSIIANMYDETIAKDIHVIYGGGVDVNNAAEILKIRSVDGFLLGRVGLDPEAFYKIIKLAPEYIESEKIIKGKNK